jgi:hypothetical protein
MAAIFKFKMAAARGRFLSGTRPEMNRHTIKYLCANLVLLYQLARFGLDFDP